MKVELLSRNLSNRLLDSERDYSEAFEFVLAYAIEKIAFAFLLLIYLISKCNFDKKEKSKASSDVGTVAIEQTIFQIN